MRQMRAAMRPGAKSPAALATFSGGLKQLFMRPSATNHPKKVAGVPQLHEKLAQRSLERPSKRRRGPVRVATAATAAQAAQAALTAIDPSGAGR